MALGLNDFDAGKSITRANGRGGPLEGVGHWNEWALVIDVARIKIFMSCAV
jgi:hypothetical protein